MYQGLNSPFILEFNELANKILTEDVGVSVYNHSDRLQFDFIG